MLFPSIYQKKALFLSMAMSLVLFGCSQTTPSAQVEPDTQSTTAAETAKTTSKEDSTLKNLQAAYNGESNAHLMYLAYAKKAEEEGYKGAASLFKAAARAEEIHRDNHAKVIKEMGGTPENNLKTPEVKSTKENLENAVKGETYERQEMYPEFIKEAEKEGKKDAVETFTYASDAEAQHAQLYKQALEDMDNWKVSKDLYVCPVSGATTITDKQNNCATTDGTKKPLEKVS
ncbi:rubrerythrin family protein [Gloeothece verrucosa]|uniref:Rubrerythrin n=1 Tax=Gloeothece verrucosa (strain PCC 7822) TaxID=497965 RepID=E0UDW8_GLOV7|nr:rubrerythrin family protein [Gloeothece verrucosa]ADN16553.1 Rubrerythrin [Gloeothece verrucosa PCC 7822]